MTQPNEEIKTTCLHSRHVALGAQMSPFAGFDMPIQYVGIEEEHQAVRTAAGVFDVSHMGEVLIEGSDAPDFISRLVTADTSKAHTGQIFYGMMLRPDGGTVDDLLVYHRNNRSWLLVINAANIDKDLEWIRLNARDFNDVTVTDLSPVTAEIAVQGPKAEEIMTQVLGIDCADLSFYTFGSCTLPGGLGNAIVSRTGYTGEDGFEIYGSPEAICHLWDTLIDSGRCVPCGLGCRDTLRFEVGLPLYGHELADDITPLEASLSMFAPIDKEGGFIGSDALKHQKAEGLKRRLVGLTLHDRAIARAGYPVLDPATKRQIGHVTTGYRGISVDSSLAMALIETEFAEKGTEVLVQIRRRVFPATVGPRKFYKKSYKK